VFWCDRRGANANCADGTANVATALVSSRFGDAAVPTSGISTPTFSTGSPVAERLSMAMTFYSVAFSVTFERSVGKFWFGINDDGSTNSTLQDNGGKGYIPDDDEIVYLPVGSGDPIITTTNLNKTSFPVYIAAGVRICPSNAITKIV
jgi:hypothetical protein